MEPTATQNQAEYAVYFEEQIILPLKKHTYPLWIKILGLFVIWTFLFLMMIFLRFDLQLHRQVSREISTADKLFSDKKYRESFVLYQEILDKHLRFMEGKNKLACICFALTAEDSSYYLQGLRYLSHRKYGTYELEEIKSFLPQEYRKDFESRFVAVKEK